MVHQGSKHARLHIIFANHTVPNTGKSGFAHIGRKHIHGFDFIIAIIYLVEVEPETFAGRQATRSVTRIGKIGIVSRRPCRDNHIAQASRHFIFAVVVVAKDFRCVVRHINVTTQITDIRIAASHSRVRNIAGRVVAIDSQVGNIDIAKQRTHVQRSLRPGIRKANIAAKRGRFHSQRTRIHRAHGNFSKQAAHTHGGSHSRLGCAHLASNSDVFDRDRRADLGGHKDFAHEATRTVTSRNIGHNSQVVQRCRHSSGRTRKFHIAHKAACICRTSNGTRSGNSVRRHGNIKKFTHNLPHGATSIRTRNRNVLEFRVQHTKGRNLASYSSDIGISATANGKSANMAVRHRESSIFSRDISNKSTAIRATLFSVGVIIGDNTSVRSRNLDSILQERNVRIRLPHKASNHRQAHALRGSKIQTIDLGIDSTGVTDRRLPCNPSHNGTRLGTSHIRVHHTDIADGVCLVTTHFSSNDTGNAAPCRIVHNHAGIFESHILH